VVNLSKNILYYKSEFLSYEFYFVVHSDLSRTALGPTQPPIQWTPGALSLMVKRPGREADHWPPSSAEVKNAWRYTSTPPIRPHGGVVS
jgi:hypothetical protein